MKKIIVHIDGGVVQFVSSITIDVYDMEAQSIIIVDTDIEGVESAELTTTVDKNGNEIQARVYEAPTDFLPLNSDIRLLIETWQQKETQ